MPRIIPVENIEDVRNKIDSLDGEVSDEQYPSAKAVKDALENVSVDADSIDLTSKQDKFADVILQEGSNFPELNSEGRVSWFSDGLQFVSKKEGLGISILTEDEYDGVKIGSSNQPYSISSIGITSDADAGTHIHLETGNTRLRDNYRGSTVGIYDAVGNDTLYDTTDAQNIALDDNGKRIFLNTDKIIVGRPSEITNMSNKSALICNVANPESNNDAANKQYVDTSVSNKLKYCTEEEFNNLDISSLPEGTIVFIYE